MKLCVLLKARVLVCGAGVCLSLSACSGLEDQATNDAPNAQDQTEPEERKAEAEPEETSDKQYAARDVKEGGTASQQSQGSEQGDSGVVIAADTATPESQSQGQEAPQNSEDHDEAVMSQEGTVESPEGYEDMELSLHKRTEKDDFLVEEEEQQTSLLDCHLVSGYFISTFSVHLDSEGFLEDFTEEDSKKVLASYVDRLDFGKFYFAKQDVEEIYNSYVGTLKDDLLNFKCDTILDIHALWAKRVQEREKVFREQIYAAHDFTVKESMVRAYHREFLDEKDIPDRVRKVVKSHILLADEDDEDLLQGNISQDTLDAVEKIVDSYVKKAQEADLDSIYGEFLSAAYGSLDKMTDFYEPQVGNLHTDSLSSLIRGKIGTILVSSEKGNGLEVEFIFHNSPAQKHGFLQEGDRLIAVRQSVDEKWQSYKELGQNDFINAIRGEEGTTVYLRMERDNANGDLETYEINMERDDFNTHSNSANYHYFQVPSQLVQGQEFKVGYISVTSFKNGIADSQVRKYSPGTSKLVSQAMAELVDVHNVHALVMDLRDNSGGYMNEATLMLEKLAGPDVMFYSKSRETQFEDYPSLIEVLRNIKTSLFVLPKRVEPERMNVENYSRKSYENLPIVVLVNRISASASELLTQGLKLSRRVIIVGDPSTFGKGTIQSQQLLTNDYLHKVTVGRFYGMDGVSINDVGVKADIVIPSLTGAMTQISQYARGNYGDGSVPEVKTLPTHFHKSLDLGYRNKKIISFLEERSAGRAHEGTLLQRAWQWYRKAIEIKADFSSSLSLSIHERRRKKAAEKLADGDPSEVVSTEAAEDGEEESSPTDQTSFPMLMAELEEGKGSIKRRLEYDPDVDVSAAFQKLYDMDYVMQEALSIAADYFVLCRGGDKIQGTDSAELQSLLQGNMRNQGCESFTLEGDVDVVEVKQEEEPRTEAALKGSAG